MRIVPDASEFRTKLETQLKSQQVEFVLQVRADAQKAREEINELRREEEARAVDLRVNTSTVHAREQVDRMRVEQEARAMHLRVEVDRSSMSGLSQAVQNARQQVVAANNAIVASERRVEGVRRQVATANDAIVASERGVSNARQNVESHTARVSAAERRLSELRQSQASEINPLVAAAENAVERARAKGNAEGVARAERNLGEMRKALAAPTHEIERAEEAVAEARRRSAVADNNLAQSIDRVAGTRRRAEQAESNLTQALENSTNARGRSEQASRNLATTVDNEIQKSRDLSRELNTLGKDFGQAFSLKGLGDAFASVVPVLGMLPALSTGLAEAAAAVEQLAGASLALPGIFAGIGASLGTLLVGVQGITEAYEALGRQAAESGNDQRQHAIEVRQANESLTTATRSQAEAERDRARAVRDSRQEQEDLNLQLRGGQLSTAEAILEAQKARRDLAEGHFKDGLDYQSGQMRVLDADQRVAESMNNQNKLKTRDADMGDRVANANDRVASSNQRVADAMQHLADVNTKVSATTRAVDTAMAMLGPNAAEFTKTIFELTRSGALHDLQVNTSQNLFSGMGASIKELVAADLPTLTTGMGAVASSMNKDFKQLFSSLGSDHSKNVLEAIFGDTAHAQDLLKTAINPIVDAFGTLAKAGADTLPRMADGVGRAADRFDKFISAADKDGRLDKWINAGITGFTHLGDIFINLGKSVHAISSALGGPGLLAMVDDLTKKLVDFLNSTKGQDDLRRIFADGRAELEQLKPILEALPEIFKGVFGSARDAVAGWLPLLQTVAGILKDWPGLTEGILDGFLAWRSLNPVFTLVGDGIGLLSKGMGSVQTQITNSRVLADSEMSTTAKIFQKVAGEEGVGKLTGALNTLSGLAGPVGLAAVAVAIPLAELAFKNLNKATDEAKESARQLDVQERTLESTLDRVSGKITAATRSQAIQSAQNFNQSGAGGGIPGQSQGNALEAATKLGIPPDVYASALMGDPAAVAQVRDILFKNNLGPEFQANSALKGDLGAAASVGLSQEDVFNALIGSPGAVDKYKQSFISHGQSDPTGTDLDLTHIGQQLSPSGQASVLSGLAMTHQQQVTGSAQAGQQQGQQADFGRWRLSGLGQQDLGLPDSTQVNADDKGYHVSLPDIPASLGDKLKQLSVTPTKNFDGSWSFVLPKGSPDVEKYEQGGGTPHATGPLDDGGYYAVLHPSEYVANKTGRAALGDEFLGAANTGVVDPSLLPHFDAGGPANEFGPTDQSSDQQEQQSGSVMAAVQSGISGLQNPINNIISFVQSQSGGDQGDGKGASGGGGRFGGGGLMLPHFYVGGPAGPAPLAPALGDEPHVGTGARPGPAPSLLPGFTSGAQAGLGNAPAVGAALPGIPPAGTTPSAEIAGSVPGVPGTDRFAGMPGLWGLIGVQHSADQGAAMQAWTGQTQNYLTKWGLNFATNAASIAYGGVLGGLGLDKSILSPSNQWTAAAISGVTGAIDHMASGDQGAQQFSSVLGSLSSFGGLSAGSGNQLGTALNNLTSPMGAANPAVSNFLQTGNLDPSASGMPGLSNILGTAQDGSSGGMPMPARDSITYTPDAVKNLGIPPLATNPTDGSPPSLPGWLTAFVKQFGPSLNPTSTPHGALHGVPGGPDWATDVVGSAQEMDALAGYLKANPGLSVQLIHKSQITGQDYGIAGGADVSGRYYTTAGGTYEDELTMVHWAPAGMVIGGVGNAAGNAAGPATPGGVNPAMLAAGKGWFQGWTPGNASGPISGASGHGDAKMQQVAQALYMASGMPPGEWGAFDQLISHESGWNPTAQNPGSTAYGLGQFLDSTWAGAGGSKTSDPVKQLQYIFQYLKSRPDYHGSPEAAWDLWQARSPHWYDVGGDWATGTIGVNMSGKTETVLTHEQSQGVHQALTTAAQTINSSTPEPSGPSAQAQAPDAQHMTPSQPSQPSQVPGIAQGPQGPNMLPETPQPTAASPGGAPGGQPAPPAALGPLGPQAQQPVGAATVHGAGPDKEQGAWGPDSGMHVAPALKTGITSAASAIGQAASTAIGIAGAGAGMFGGGAIGAAGPYVAGLINEGGKIAVDIANVPSSLMVGTLTPGTTANPSGQTYHPQQAMPAVAASSRTTNNGPFYGHNTDDVLDMLNLRESQEQQSHLANYRPPGS